MRRLFACALLLTCLTRPLGAVHGMTITVQADRILIGTDFVPRYLDLPNKLVVGAGQTVTLPADATFDYIEVAGTLKCDRSRDTVARFTHFFVLPGGVFDCGTEADPIPATRRVTLIVRDVPIDTARDPFQWGNGFLNFGTRSLVGAGKATWGPLAAEAVKGATTLSLAFDPQGWAVGDELVMTDTAQQSPAARPRREPGLTVAAIAGRTVTLSTPLVFDHKAILDPDGAVVLQGRVANLSRNVVIKSENPQGTPGHTASVGADAHWQTRYVRFDGLGRTKNVTLNSQADNKPGTNQVGRYEEHHHHGYGFGSATVGNAYVAGVGKWGFSQHGTHDEPITDNVAVGFNGSGFVTEDGYEVRNQYLRNFAIFNLGAPTDDLNAEAVATGTGAASANNPGGTGNGFWFRGVMNRFEGNEAWNNHIGINLFNQTQAPGMYPSQAGGEHDTTFSRFVAVPIAFEKNVAAANESTSFEYWGVPRFQNKGAIGANSGVGQLFQAQSEGASPWLTDFTLVGQGRSFGIHVSPAYSFTLTLEKGRIVGTDYGIHGGGGNLTTMTDVVLQNIIDADYTQLPLSITYTRVTHKRYGANPPQYLVLDAKPSQGVSEWIRQRGTQLKVFANQGTAGQDFRLFHSAQRGSLAAPYATGDQYPDAYTQPEAGITEAQAWAKYGMAYRGEAFDDTKVVPFEGLINGFAVAGATTTLGAPKGVVTSPNSREPAVIRDGGITLHAILTGDYMAADDVLIVSVDGGADVLAGPGDGTGSTPDIRTTVTNNVATGPHEVRTWRRDLAHAKIASSLLTFAFTVGSVAPPVDICPNIMGIQTTVPMGRVLVNGQCLCAMGTIEDAATGACVAPTPTETKQPAGQVFQLFVNGAAQNRFFVCPTATTCVELVVK
jgi:hypothetical protein